MPNFFNTCDQAEMPAGVVTKIEVETGYMPQQPKIFREIAAPVNLTTSFQRIDLATENANTFQNLGTKKLVDWDSGSKLFTFNDTTTRNYIATLNLKATLTGVVLPPLLAPVYVQFRFVVPDGNGPGVPYYFPFSTGDGYMDLQEMAYNAPMRHQRLTPITSDANKRATGVGCEARINALPLTGTVALSYFSIYMFGA